ncbi:SMC-Scp complex subunit ScpB [Rhodanobacter sp. DHB23]|uniref:SMC-Scp complex subunit ScpB n=1 Tax=Rhodanobacter sp. DHB23 TaxID=2775923 RepID=UPI0017866A0E|nr:SMC-Scp complex subunit ScpB [Rhodanobacter sp. DHB23]MBD8873897.1 SMC-Scp complex subunit ScpB [Rhodanobacter sp. DHB23]
MQIEQLKPIVEAALLAASQPMTVAQIGDLFGETDEVGHEQIARALEALAADCAGRGVELKEVASGFRYQVRQEVHPWVSRMWTEKPSRYSRALLETLALIAYRQPITRPEIEQIRGVVVSSNIIKTLEEREWIRVVGHRDVPGRPALFGTTRAFLDYFSLKSLDQLPPLSEIRDMEDPQMGFEQTPLPARIIKDLPIDPDEAEDAETAAEEHEDTRAGTDEAPAGSGPVADTTGHAAEPGATEPSTADEAAAPADVEDDATAQNSQEQRA